VKYIGLQTKTIYSYYHDHKTDIVSTI